MPKPYPGGKNRCILSTSRHRHQYSHPRIQSRMSRVQRYHLSAPQRAIPPHQHNITLLHPEITSTNVKEADHNPSTEQTQLQLQIPVHIHPNKEDDCLVDFDLVPEIEIVPVETVSSSCVIC